MYHFMKQNRNARDGPFYEAKLQRQRNGYTILRREKKKQRMDHFMKQNWKTQDDPLDAAKRKRKGWTIL
jgi:hypothetical protein